MTAGLAHDLNKPLSSIQSLAFACQQRLSGERSGDEALSENLEEIRNQADRARRIIQRVRLFIRNAAPRRVENPINQLVDEAIRLSESDPALEGITVEAALDLAGPVVVVDGTLIEQVILNLMRNAGEALQTSDIPERRVVLETRYVPGRGVEVAVSDNGPGMPPGVARDAFQPFFSTKEEGLGMGLTICRSIIEAHGGTITAESNPSGGTTFRFVVPAS
ncbi:MAG: ATP-binding protein [Candidatus Eisenbacteria bacterium]